MSRKIIGPFSRVEGHLEIDLNKSDTQVLDARVNSPMYRGMEAVMHNRPMMDALTIVPRICGICSVSQSVAAARALAALGNMEAPQNGQLVTNLILACEMLSNHLTHFYLFFMPDFARPIYQDKNWYQQALRFKAQTGPAQSEALQARTRFLHIMGELAGKWPHTLTIRPGGSTQTVITTQKLKLKTLLSGMRRFLEISVFATSLEEMLAIKSISDLETWSHNNTGDLGTFLSFSKDLQLSEMGKTSSVLLSGGGFTYADEDIFSQGIFENGQHSPLSAGQIAEDVSHCFMDGPTIQPPYQGLNEPLLDKENAYSWCKAPRLNGKIGEVGALARHVINDHPLFTALYETQSSTVENRIFARTWEMALLISAMEKWVDAIDPDAPFYQEAQLPKDGQGVAFIEAARGTLGHWITVEDGRIANYQIVAPTTWNFSPRDQNDQPGPLESALEGAPILAGETDPVSVQHIVRSFDPCMACTVH